MRVPFTEFKWRTSMPVNELAQVLQSRVVSNFALFKSRTQFPVSGRVLEKSAVLAVRPPAWFHNSFNRVLAVHFEATTDGGTVLRGVFRLRYDVAVITGIWFAGVSLAVIGVSAAAALNRYSSDIGFSLLIVWGMLLFAIGMV